jgi:hypothetical protein
MVGGAGSTQPVRTIAQCTARVQESCAPLIYIIGVRNMIFSMAMDYKQE